MTDIIIGYVKELKSLDNEIKRLMIEIKALRHRKGMVESEIIDYLRENNQPGIKYNDTVILAHEKSKRSVKKKPDKIDSGVVVLKKYGVIEPDKALLELIDAMKGGYSKIPCLKIKNN